MLPLFTLPLPLQGREGEREPCMSVKGSLKAGVIPMTAEAALLTRTFRVGKRTVTLTFPRPRSGEALMMTAEWDPDPPRRLTVKELRAYRRGRDAAVAELAAELGVRAAVVEL